MPVTTRGWSSRSIGSELDIDYISLMEKEDTRSVVSTPSLTPKCESEGIFYFSNLFRTPPLQRPTRGSGRPTIIRFECRSNQREESIDTSEIGQEVEFWSVDLNPPEEI